LRRGDLGLVEVVNEARMSPDENLLVVVDQFEELFRYARISEHGPHGNQAAAFVKLLLQASAQTKLSIYIVLTMRSDYLGDCAKFWGLPEAINNGQYLIPRLTRDQRREAIMGPIGLRGAKITAQLVNQLLNDMGDDPDQLPILQHALMRTWDRWEQQHPLADPAERPPIDLPDYDAIGRMSEALSIHADEAYEELPDERSKEIVEKVFKCLTERGTGHVETRRPTRVSDLLAVTDAKFRELVPVLDVFRREGRSFLLPQARRQLRRDTLIDISHESLIRNWKRMKKWVNREAESADIYRRLVQSARLHERGQAGVLSDLEIEYALDWKGTNKPNVAWASRYHLDLVRVPKMSPEKVNGQSAITADSEIFDGAMAFLDKSQKVSRTKARNRKLTKALVAASVFLVVGFVGLYLAVRNGRSQSLEYARLLYSFEMKQAQHELEVGNYAELNRLLQETAHHRTLPSNFVERIFFKDFDENSLRSFEWNYLWKLSNGDSRTLHTFDRPIVSVECLKGSGTFAVTQNDGQILLWDAGKNNSTSVLVNAKEISFVAFASDHKTVVIAKMDGSIALWALSEDSTDLTFKLQLRSPQDPDVNSLAYSADNQFVAAVTKAPTSLKAHVYVWRTNGELKLVYDHALDTDITDRVLLAFSSDSHSLAIHYNQDPAVIDLRTMNSVAIPLSAIKNPGSQSPPPITCLAFSPDGNTLAMGRRDGSIVLWDLSDNKYLTSLNGHSQEVLKLVFSDPLGVMASASQDGAIIIWNAKTFSSADFRKKLIEQSSSIDPYTEDKTTGELRVTALHGHTGSVTSLAFTDPHTIVSGSEDWSLRSWSIDAQPEATRILGKAPSSQLHERVAPDLVNTNISSLAFSSDGGWLAAGRYDGSTTLWDLSDQRSEGIQLAPPSSGEGVVTPVAFFKTQILAAATGKSDVTLWQIGKGNKTLLTLSNRHSGRVLSLAFSDDGTLLATGGADNEVWLWEVATGKSFRGPVIKDSKAILSLAFVPRSRTLVIGSTNETALLCDLDANNKTQPLNGHKDAVTSIAFSADGKRFATGSSDTTVQLWDAQTYKSYATLKGPRKVVSLAFLPDGKRLVTASEDGRVRLWDSDPDNNQEESRIGLMAVQEEKVVPAFAIAVSPNGSTLATGNFDGTVLLRYGATEAEIRKQSQAPK
jgi:WD40 repeat protein